MKKSLKILFILLLLAPITVLADMSAPMIRPFEAVVTKKGGITVKGVNGKTKHYDENSVIIVTGYEDNYQVVIGNDYYDISDTDSKYIKPKNDLVTPNDEGVKKLEKTREFEVRSETLTVYKGPSSVYGEAGHLNKGDQVTAFYYAEVEESLPDFFYIQEENLKGWIYINEAEDGNGKVWEVNAQPLKVIIKNDITINGTSVNANSIYKIYYWAHPYYSDAPVIKVNNEMIEPALDSYEIIADSKKKQTMFKMEQYNFYLKKDIKLYTTYSLKEEITTIPAKTELSTINLMSGYEFQEDDTYYIYVAYNNKLGWIKVKGTDVEISENNYDIDELVSPYIDSEGDDGEDTEETTQAIEVKEEKDKKKFNTKETIIISVIAAISMAIMAISSIVMLNKKNKKETLKDINEELEKTQQLNVVKDEEQK